MQIRENSTQIWKEDLGENTSKMNDKEHAPIMIWLINSLKYGSATELQEIIEKYPGEAASISIGNFVNKCFKNFMIENERCKDNCAKNDNTLFWH